MHRSSFAGTCRGHAAAEQLAHAVENFDVFDLSSRMRRCKPSLVWIVANLSLRRGTLQKLAEGSAGVATKAARNLTLVSQTGRAHAARWAGDGDAKHADFGDVIRVRFPRCGAARSAPGAWCRD